MTGAAGLIDCRSVHVGVKRRNGLFRRSEKQLGWLWRAACLFLLVVDSTVQPADVTIRLRNVISPLASQLPTVAAAGGLACPGSLLVASQARQERSLIQSVFEVEVCFGAA